MAPVRWATPGMEVPCTKCPLAIAAACSQDASTPPPSPPSAAISSLMGFASRHGVTPPAPATARTRAGRAAAEQAHQRRRQPPLQAIPRRRVLDDVDLRERRAQLGRVRHLPAQPAADAVVVDVGDGIGAQRVLVRLDGERRAARQADAGMVARAHLRIDPEARAHHALAGRDHARASSGRMRRWRASWHSPSAMMTLRPFWPVRSASRSVSTTPATP